MLQCDIRFSCVPLDVMPHMRFHSNLLQKQSKKNSFYISNLVRRTCQRDQKLLWLDLDQESESSRSLQSKIWGCFQSFRGKRRNWSSLDSLSLNSCLKNSVEERCVMKAVQLCWSVPKHLFMSLVFSIILT